MNDNKNWALSQHSMFKDLSEKDLNELDQIALFNHYEMIPINTVIQTPGSAKEGLFFLKQGKIRLYKISPEGKQYTIGILGNGSMYGSLNMLSFNTDNLYMETMIDTFICGVKKEPFEQFLIQRPELGMKFLKELSARIKERDEMLEALALGSLQDRILYLLLKLAVKYGIPKEEGFVLIDIHITHQDVANMVAATREAVTIVLKRMINLGLIRTGRKEIMIHLEQVEKCMEGKFS
ncbi:hypothetical protein SY83_19925 [Paenibacillus swuensis]|uniref:cAMP-binding protein n=1 Tax=Paenibacillus swuensis TaxID=1178515 RepID=A0A172TMR7_9BACL|nr:Crp/Fnr family transcriptional regulator [Paenibacillus swuensis]ANE48184.1 hypothetical protein SY83_19925 [Paenibacillus swuensis]